MKTPTPARIGFLLSLALAGQAHALQEAQPTEAVNNMLQTRIDQKVSHSIERAFYTLDESGRALRQQGDAPAAGRADALADAECPAPPTAPTEHQYLSAR